MARQLTLLETPPSWRLDDATREVGRRGVAEARATLLAALGAPAPAKRARPEPKRTRRGKATQRRSAA